MSKFWAHDNPFDVYMTPLSNDNPVGEWISFPTTAEKLRDVFLRKPPAGLNLNDKEEMRYAKL